MWQSTHFWEGTKSLKCVFNCSGMFHQILRITTKNVKYDAKKSIQALDWNIGNESLEKQKVAFNWTLSPHYPIAFIPAYPTMNKGEKYE